MNWYNSISGAFFALLLSVALNADVTLAEHDGPRFVPINDTTFFPAIDLWYYAERDADAIYGPIEKWNTSKVTTMRDAFKFHPRYYRQFNKDISKWNTSNVNDMSGMFNNATLFNHDIGDWDTSKVNNMTAMFHDAHAFNQDISRWDTSKVTSLSKMFMKAEAFNQNLSPWDVSQVTSFTYMFSGAKSLVNQTFCWDILPTAERAFMFWGGPVNSYVNEHCPVVSGPVECEYDSDCCNGTGQCNFPTNSLRRRRLFMEMKSKGVCAVCT